MMRNSAATAIDRMRICLRPGLGILIFEINNPPVISSISSHTSTIICSGTQRLIMYVSGKMTTMLVTGSP